VLKPRGGRGGTTEGMFVLEGEEVPRNDHTGGIVTEWRGGLDGDM